MQKSFTECHAHHQQGDISQAYLHLTEMLKLQILYLSTTL